MRRIGAMVMGAAALAVAVGCFGGSGEAPIAASSGPVVTALADADLEYGCACTFAFGPGESAEGYVLSGSVDETWYRIRVDGSLLTLTAAPGADGAPVYQSDGVALRMTTTATQPCPPGEEGCEAVGYERTLEVTRDGARTEIRAIGSCGC